MSTESEPQVVVTSPPQVMGTLGDLDTTERSQQTPQGDTELEVLRPSGLTELTFEVRTELDNIIGFSDMLTEDLGQNHPWALEDIESIRKSAKKVFQLIARLEQHVDSAKKEASRDPLTGIANRRAFEVRCGALVEERSGAPLSLVLIDLDRFKDVNDTLGHLVGDDVLKGVVERCRRAVRDSDLLARLAGDEFVLLLPSTPEDEAIRVADRVRASVVESPIATRKGAVPITVSLGVATHDGDGGSVGDLIERADKAMYRSKHGGRDKVSTLSD